MQMDAMLVQVKISIIHVAATANRISVTYPEYFSLQQRIRNYFVRQFSNVSPWKHNELKFKSNYYRVIKRLFIHRHFKSPFLHIGVGYKIDCIHRFNFGATYMYEQRVCALRRGSKHLPTAEVTDAYLDED